jgi:two-component system, NtrC family, response regulator HydG
VNHHPAKILIVDDEAAILRAYSWPGNVRELRNIIERAVILAKGTWIEPSHLPVFLLSSSDSESKFAIPGKAAAAEAEKELILKTLQGTGNNKAEAARKLGLDVKTIRNKLKKYGIN